MILDSLSNSELAALLRAARDRRPNDRRDWLMLLVAFTHGLRASEVVAIERDDVRDGFLSVRRRKGSIATVQPLLEHPDPLFSERAALIELAGQARTNQKLFPITRQHFWAIMQRAAVAAGVPKHKAHPHALKHSCARQLIDSAGIHRTQAWLGHKSMASTGKYLNPTNEEVAAAAHLALKTSRSD